MCALNNGIAKIIYFNVKIKLKLTKKNVSIYYSKDMKLNKSDETISKLTVITMKKVKQKNACFSVYEYLIKRTLEKL